MTERTPLEWHSSPKAQALIGLIAAAGHQPQTRNVRDPISSNRAPQYHQITSFDCDEYLALTVMLQEARRQAMEDGQALHGQGVEHDAAYADFFALSRLDLVELIQSEIARRGLQVAA
ncbi:MAG: hypothetical protein ACT6Q7_02710 [Blastomonas fulva]|uniref:hypothetical protein n=1 Tax=Blastomonas fulva TaxID=1550728 RepID=UPI00403321FA